MIKYIHGSLFNSSAQTLVNPVNTVGVMGKGLAKVFKLKYPRMYSEYHYFCRHGLFTMGKLWLYRSSSKWILCFPTKINWRDPSKLSYIKDGLQKLSACYRQQRISSIAFPLLGVGCGGLNWSTQVRPLMERYLNQLRIPVYVYIYR